MGEQSQQKSVWFWRESCVKVANNSDYKVSYWVEQECKLKTTAVNETVVTTIQTKLNGNTKAEAGNCITEAPSVSVGARAAKRARKETSVTKEKTEMESYFLLKDYRYILETSSSRSIKCLILFAARRLASGRISVI